MSGTVDVRFQLPRQIPAAWLGQTLVAFETVSQSGVTVAIHADVTDEGHTVHVPAIGTTATNANAELGKTVTAGMLVDRVAYRGLEPGREYIAWGEFQLVVDGKAQPTGIIGSSTFTAQYSVGAVDVEFEVSAEVVARLAGKDLVAFETLTSGGAVVDVHADVADQGQTVQVPTIGTTATNKVPQLGKTVVAGGTLTDTIAYSNLTLGQAVHRQG